MIGIFHSSKECTTHSERRIQTLTSAGDKLDLVRGWTLLHHEAIDVSGTLRHRWTGLSCVLPPDVVGPHGVDVKTVDTSCIKKNYILYYATVKGFDAEAWSCQNFFPRLGKVLKRRVSDDMGATCAVSDGADEASSVGFDGGASPALRVCSESNFYSKLA